MALQYIPSTDPRPPGGMAEIQLRVAWEYRVPLADIKGRCKKRGEVVRARHEFMWRCRQIKWPDGSQRYSLPQIGAFLGVDHTTVLYGVRKHEARLKGGA